VIYLAKNKFLKAGLVIGLIFIIFGPMIGGLFETLSVRKEKDKTISEDSAVYFADAAAYGIRIKRNQKYIIKFSVYSQNVSATLKIFGKGTYDSERIKNDTNAPQTVTGRYFLVSQPSWAWDPSSTDDTRTSVTCNQDDFYYIEFMGDGQASSDLIWSEPGDFVILIYGTNSFVNGTAVTYNIEIYKSGPSDLVRTIFSYSGWGILLIAGLVICTRLIKQWRGTE
jgi:hypothetical protein